jgi:hypothetical protein
VKNTKAKTTELAPYEVLGVSPSATPAEVTAAYKVLAQIFHPDRFADSPENVRREAEVRMKTLNEAYSFARRGHLVDRPPPNGLGDNYKGGPGYTKWAGVPWEEACRRRAQQAAKANADRAARDRAARSGNAVPVPRRGRTFPSKLTGLGLAEHTQNVTCRNCRTLMWLPEGWKHRLADTVYFCSNCENLLLAR